MAGSPGIPRAASTAAARAVSGALDEVVAF
jgi:hypothetical protein